MKISMIILGLTVISSSVFANGVDQFCAPQAAAAAQALANVNGSVSDTVVSSITRNGKVFSVILSEQGLDNDAYTVTTSGGHDCTVYSVKMHGEPTLRP
jgi:hypothetical protein